MTYPILQFFVNDKNIYGAAEGPERATVSLFDTFKNSIILDSAGIYYKVKSVRRIGWDYLWGYHPLTKGRTAFIEYEFSDSKQLDLPAFKKLVVDKLSSGVKKDFWYSQGDIPSLIDKVNKCVDHRFVVACFV